MMCCKIVKLSQNSKFCKILGGGLNIDYKEMERRKEMEQERKKMEQERNGSNVNFVEAANYIKRAV